MYKNKFYLIKIHLICIHFNKEVWFFQPFYKKNFIHFL
ncbi:hypothetical protein B4090_3331 [Bacillus licheniformis]|uniref:Uncharacterized protein n=1 Tax=Bacillus paralicheniformis TaxID=1648923 RepID=A0A6N2GZQ0_9BACI|nr:hypothetical protein SC10_B2orf04775 [Bacillus paralicheniformis]KYC76645.1 hypothetical protein B4090_3331 [Bacillus licheniformis]OLF96673.1 hypothetical protein B4121_0884 [Bacillus paralicheniformis]TWJ33669.1 hypothetical protein CHCC5027_0237 [Bacillus paralicheniformis]TWJ66001.1 hypothetical protein CHCC5021_0277 [Bacillus paralicheniformis]